MISYKDFTGEPENEIIEIEIDDDLNNLVYLGDVFAIEYEIKKSKFGDKKKTLYRHEFKQRPLLIWNGDILIIAGDIKVKGAGII